MPVSINDIYFAAKTMINGAANFSSTGFVMWEEFTRLSFAGDNAEFSQPLSIQKFGTSFIFAIGK